MDHQTSRSSRARVASPRFEARTPPQFFRRQPFCHHGAAILRRRSLGRPVLHQPGAPRPLDHPRHHARRLCRVSFRVRGHLLCHDWLLRVQPLSQAAPVRVLQRLRRRTADLGQVSRRIHRLATPTRRRDLYDAGGRTPNALRPSLLARADQRWQPLAHRCGRTGRRVRHAAAVCRGCDGCRHRPARQTPGGKLSRSGRPARPKWLIGRGWPRFKAAWITT